ncbi:ABC transporter ATP-binding protein [Pelagibacterium montanilacus]|uniref:ABC transporter ATP-binding protein n=1 Tax=Pelagibacterium montanilacus TaxID=2185280 RepID=UPI000F8C7B7C|nr:sn-glycerol-3-phosphate ABC transporter ATP-binding protein UgpC [Pelagibacterium montanilacus]
MAPVTISSVRKSYGSSPAIKGISFDISDGEFITLVGPSGCGKSTLLRMIAGLEDITSGDISIDGAVVNDLTPRERNIAMVFQNYALYPHMTVRDNMGFSLKIAKAPASEIASAVERASRILGLEPLLDRYPRQLSGGQRQRVAMGRAIVRNPKVFLFDEPLSNLDAQLRVQMRAEIKQLHHNVGTTMIYVTHDQIEAMTMADRIVVMRDGIIEQIGTPLDLYDRPANVFVARFIGSPAMNHLEGRIRQGPGGPEFATGDMRLPLPGGTPPAETAILGFRPEHVTIDPDGLPVTVEVVEPTGAETQVVGRLAGQPVICAFRDRLSLKTGDTLHIRPDPERLHLFEADTGNRLNT